MRDRDTKEKSKREWEHTFDDLNRELTNVQGELTEKDQLFQQVERELQNKLRVMDQVEG